MKFFRKILLISLALLLLLPLAACSKGSDGDAPEGMQCASRESDPFVFYVPTDWSLNTQSGLASAYIALAPYRIFATAFATGAADGETVDGYLARVENVFAATSDEFSLKGGEASILGPSDALCRRYALKESGADYTVTAYTALAGGYFVTLFFHVPDAYADMYAEEFEEIRANFAFREPKKPEAVKRTDKKTPEGMIIASSDDLEYRLYVPKTWIYEGKDDKAAEAYVDETGRPNVTVTSYSPDDVMTAREYVDACRAEYEKKLPGYALIGTEETTVAAKEAVRFTYEVTVDGVTFRLRQTVFVFREMVYSLTYTAPKETFSLHLADVDAMEGAFRFR